MKTKLTKKFWIGLVVFSLTGQIAWIVENMYFNVFIYKMFHASAAQISLMVSASAVAATLTTLFIGALSDKYGKRKIIICLGYIFWGISILSFALIRMDFITKFAADTATAFSIGITLVIVMDCVMTFFGSSANDACFQAWLTDMGDDSNRGAIEGINSMMPLLAILVVFGGFMSFDLEQQTSWVIIYLMIGIAVILIGFLGFFLIDEKKIDTGKKQSYFANIIYGFRKSVILENKLLYLVLCAFSVFGISIQVFMPYLILYYEKTLGMKNYVMIMAPAIILASVVTAFYGRIYDRLQFKLSVIPTLIALMSGYLFLFFGRSVVPVFIGSLLMMTGYLTGMAVFGAMIKDHIPKDKAGLFQGLRMFAQVFLPGMIGPVIGALVLTNAEKIVNNDGTTSFLPSADIYLAAFAVAVGLLVFLAYIFEMMKREHRDLLMDQYEDELSLESAPYPRPQLCRDSFYSLNGTWDIKMSSSRQIPKEWTQTIRVPYPPQAYLSEYDMQFTHHGMRKKPKVYDHFWYRRKFALSTDFLKERVLLHFDAVDQIAVIYLNGVNIYKNKGGYLPFEVDITDWLKDENELVVEVTDHLSTVYPYGKQCKKRGGMWYTEVSGIWQSVWLESVPKTYICNVCVTPSLNSVKIKTEICGEQNLKKDLCITTETGKICYSFTENEIEIPIEKPHHWTPEDPYLYEFTLQMGEDLICSYFALREITIKRVKDKNRICLNGKPYYFHGVLDQGYFSDGIYTPRSMKCYEDDILAMKRLGFNTLRKHIKVEPAVFYYACDRLGMIVFQDMVNNSKYSFFNDTVLPTLQHLKRNDLNIRRKPEAKAFFEKHCEDTLDYLYHFPSICYYTLFNEGWGQYESDRICERLRQIDSTRVWDATSGWFNQKKSDVLSLHVYFHPVILEPTDKPIIISEFGGYSHKIPEHSYSVHGTYGYGDYDSKEALTEAVCRLYREEIIPDLVTGINGSIYTQVSDVEDETNGFLTYDRKEIKVDEAKMREVSELIYSTYQEVTKSS